VGCAMQRNRMLVALSRVMVLAEPGLRGGTGGTGKIALDLGVPLYILQTSEGSGEGTEGFLKAGAHPLSLDGLNPGEISELFQQSWEASEATRKALKMETLFPP